MMTSACRQIMGQDHNGLITVAARWQCPQRVPGLCSDCPGGGGVAGAAASTGPSLIFPKAEGLHASRTIEARRKSSPV